MIIEQTFTVEASREKTAEFFADIEQVGSCIPGVEGVRELEAGRYEATLAVRLGPIRAAFKGAISLDDGEAPKRLKASGEGRDRATGSTAKIDFTADLSEDAPGVTTVRTVADVAIRGRLSQFGTGVMRAAAGELVQEFAGCANAKLAAASGAAGSDGSRNAGRGSEPAAHPSAQGTSSPPAQRGLLKVVLRSLVRSLARALRRAADRIETRLDGSEGPR